MLDRYRFMSRISAADINRGLLKKAVEMERLDLVPTIIQQIINHGEKALQIYEKASKVGKPIEVNEGGVEHLKEDLDRYRSIIKEIEDNKLDSEEESPERQLFLRVATASFYLKDLGELERKLGRYPNQTEIADSIIQSLRRVYDASPNFAFQNEEEFESWISRREKVVRSRVDGYKFTKFARDLRAQ